MLAKVLKEGVCQSLRGNCSNSGWWDCLQRRSIVVDVDGLFISRPVIVKIIEDKRPICRYFRFSLVRIRALFPESQVEEDAFYDVGFMNQADDFFSTACNRYSHLDPVFLMVVNKGDGAPSWLSSEHESKADQIT